MLLFVELFFFDETARIITAKISIKRIEPKTISGILNAGSECKTVVEGVINMPPR